MFFLKKRTKKFLLIKPRRLAISLAFSDRQRQLAVAFRREGYR
jgi:hypothetical protein